MYSPPELTRVAAPERDEQADLEFLHYMGNFSFDDQTSNLRNATPVTVHPQTPAENDSPIDQVTAEEEEEAEVDRSQHCSEIVESIDEQAATTSEALAECIEEEELHWPIALRKKVRSCRTNVKYPIGQYVKYEKLGSKYKAFLSLLREIVIPSKVDEALWHSGWKAAMDEEMSALEKNNTWEITTLSQGKKAIGCRWVFTPKFRAGRMLEKLKA